MEIERKRGGGGGGGGGVGQRNVADISEMTKVRQRHREV